MSDCANCKGCSQCGNGGCQIGTLELTEGEIALLEVLGQFAFLPVSREYGDPTPYYLEERDRPAAEYSRILQLLEKRGLICLSYDAPLPGCHCPTYDAHPYHGSMGLTERGQRVLEVMEFQGLSDNF